MQLSKRFARKLQGALRFLPALRLVWQASPRWTAARLGLVICQGLLPLCSIYLSKLLIDALASQITAANKEAVFSQVLLLLAFAGLITLATVLCTILSELVNTAHAQRVTDYMQGIIHTKSTQADLEYYENARYYDTLQRAQQEASYRPTQILNRVEQVGQSGISVLVMTGLLLSLHWVIAPILIVAALPAALVRTNYARVMYRWQRRRTSLERQTSYLGWMLTIDMFAKEIRLFNLGTFFSEWYQRVRQQLYQERLSIATRRSIASFLAQVIAGALMVGVYIFIVYQVIQGKFQLGDLVLYHQAFQRGQNDLRGFLSGISGLYEDNLFLSNLYEFLDLKPSVSDPIQPVPIPTPLKTGIVFEQVSFQYGTTTRQALQDINLKIGPGEVVALVGENGSGKTTLVKLLCRLYDPTVGRITIDGIDLREFAIADLRRQISVIFQDYAKYYFSARENIWVGDITLPHQDDRIIAAARRSGADDVITRLPQSYETPLGKWFEHGEELSIGQWQKVALARAFLRNAQLIVLDEPTSAMDPKAEYEVFEKFRQLIQGQSAILISHRLSTVKMADRIYALVNGSIAESGTHKELMQRNGPYAQLYEIQAQQYR
jgi:ATP-binding cassette, subfamily B, bacterial